MSTLNETDSQAGTDTKLPLREKIPLYLIGAIVLWLVYNQ